MKSSEGRKNPESRSSVRNERGFSLIELVLTVVLIGIIAAVAVAKYINLSDRAKTAVCRTNQCSLESAQNIYFAEQLVNKVDSPHYAGSLEELAPYMAGNRIPTCPLGFGYEILSQWRIRCRNPDHDRHS